MKKILLYAIVGFMFHFATAQKAVTTYYDWNKIHPKEKYTVNSSGQKTGPYKQYSQNGVVVAEYNFVNGELNGVCTEYFEREHNDRALKVKATYKAGVKNGAYIEYYTPDLLKRQGNYINGNEEGLWTIVEEFMNDVQPTGYEYYKSETQMKNGNDVTTGPQKFYYYPSGKLFKELLKDNGKVVGDQTMYRPDGTVVYLDSLGRDKKKIAEMLERDKAIGADKQYKQRMYDAGVRLDAKDYSGARTIYKSLIQVEAEYFIDKSGNPAHTAADKVRELDSIIIIEETKKKEAQINKVEADSLDKVADKLFEAKDYQNARDNYSASITRMNKSGTTDMYAFKKENEIDRILAIEEKMKMEELKKQSNQMDSMYRKFSSIYHVKDSYPKGESLFKKSDALLQELMSDYKQSYDTKKSNSGKYIITVLEKLIALENVKTRDLEKSMKTASTGDDVKKVLGV